MYYNYIISLADFFFRLSHEMVGPLTMHPATENNYGLDACSLLCLPVQPPVVIMATATGRIYHCIALETPEEDSELEPGSDDEVNC